MRRTIARRTRRRQELGAVLRLSHFRVDSVQPQLLTPEPVQCGQVISNDTPQL